jgi:iron(III) transport system ATP-binding protein
MNPLILDGEEAKHCDVLLRADDIVHDDEKPWSKPRFEKVIPRIRVFVHPAIAHTGETVMAHVPSHHESHKLASDLDTR